MKPPTVVNIRSGLPGTYIGRAGKGQSGYLGNPFPVNEEVSLSKAQKIYNEYFESWFPSHKMEAMIALIMQPRKRGESIKMHMKYARTRSVVDCNFRQAIKNLNGNLLCFCAPKACHGDNYVVLWKEFNG